MKKLSTLVLPFALAGALAAGLVHAQSIGTISIDGESRDLHSLQVITQSDGRLSVAVTTEENSDGGGDVITHTVTSSAGTGGSIFPSGSQQVNDGQIIRFDVSASSGYSIQSVSGCGGNLSGSTYTTGPITANCSVTASFQQTSTPPGDGEKDETYGPVRIIDTGVVGTDTLNLTTYSPETPDHIFAFKIKIPTGSAVKGEGRATRAHGDARAKLLTISRTAGAYKDLVDATYNTRVCVGNEFESSAVYFTSDPNADPRAWCILEPGEYYINAVSRRSLSDDTFTCRNVDTCRFYGRRVNH